MKKALSCAVMLLAVLVISGCSESSEEPSQKAADAVLNRYKTPLDDAKAVTSRLQEQQRAAEAGLPKQ
jgi:hypothetical protein